MSQVANSIGAAATEIATPTRRRKAIQTLTSDESLDSAVKLKALMLFTDKIAVCDSYLAINDEALRNEYLARIIDSTHSV